MRRRAVAGGAAGLVVMLAGGGAFAASRLLPPLPVPLVEASAEATWTPVPGAVPAVPDPATGAFAIDVSDVLGTRALTGRAATDPRPMASVAKTMTALVVLEQHPLPVGSDGPVLTMTATDVSDYTRLAAAGGSVAPVEVGEGISERQLLLGLMLPSANNMALTLARWVGGTVDAFVDRLNARAAALGMTHTHFADPDGLSPATVSSAADLVRLGETVVQNPTLVSLTSTASDTLPDGTVITNLDSLITSEPTWIGIKTGWTPQAGGCLLFAARYLPAAGATPLLVVGAVLGQPPDASVDREHPELGTALRVARDAVTAVLRGYAPVVIPTTASPPVSATLTDRASGRLLATTALRGAAVTLALPLGETLQVTVATARLGADVPSGTPVATVTVGIEGRPLGRWELVTTAAVTAPSVTERLFHG
ncbi:MAG: D-alanyl-D-alanine carboxypeptidase family protein [Candidatus Dormibacteria bacterium]